MFDLEDLSRNTGSSDRYVKHHVVLLAVALFGGFLFLYCMVGYFYITCN